MGAPMNLEVIQAVLSSERSLDELVSEYKLESIGKKSGSGVSSMLREYYRQNLLNIPGQVVASTTGATTIPEVMAILCTLLYTGYCRIEECSVACRGVSTRTCQVGTNIGAKELLSIFTSESDNPSVKIVQDTIKELLEAC